ncbi:MAG TPA: alpha/beta hydrolase-fold protein [Thermoanaerobaculia bacterium]|nr:alpha/beta hydrolase-fold protein [Thermoanaerobaculia bacterium]
MLKSLRCLACLALALAAPAFALPDSGWKRVDVPATSSYYWRYVPQSLDFSRPAPLVLFFHGAGSDPDSYMNFVRDAAEQAGCVMAMPKASGAGWGTATDEQTLAETLRLVKAELPVDARRIALAGHSAGGAWAYLVAYGSSIYSSVFSMSAPWYPVTALADPTYKPPIHMYYGSTDPNYAVARPQLEAQWDRLGISWEEDVQPGFSHNTWPTGSMAAGLQFLVSHPRPDASAGACVPGETALCVSHGRFRLEVAWDTNGSSGTGHVVPGAAADSGLFWFFGPDNWELLVKVIDGCALNGKYWVFSAATTDVHYVLTVADTATGRVVRYENPAGKAAAAITDTSAFATCP